MDESLHELHGRYRRAAKVYNAQIREQTFPEDIVSLLSLPVLTKRQFAAWWVKVSEDKSTRDRWTVRLKDPERAFQNACEKFTRAMDRIHARPAAA